MNRTVRVALFAVAAIIAAHLLDHWAWLKLVDPEIHNNDRGRMFRIAGYYPVWIAMSAALWLQTRDRSRALFLGLMPGFGGLAAEILKLLLRRERPAPHEGEYFFRSFAERPFSTSGLALPSSHALVAFAGAFALCKLYPRAWPVWLTLAAGCAATRVLAHAHFLSDVVTAAVAAWFLVEIVARKWKLET
ncbi:MAG TPA: phosphatase PAP2 family protein [Gemmatimonadales bacterium]|nr:phosphatase PAP2 family protein [Gemmatimonadales bacterium]